MEPIKKIILIIAINILFLAMSFYLYQYMVIEYDNYVLLNKVYLDVLGADEAAAVMGGGSIDSLLDEIRYTRDNLSGS
tara:strand:+ start:1229 stop:1462 length:234 start_codon:yes stop_codon:yes gene_type:complete